MLGESEPDALPLSRADVEALWLALAAPELLPESVAADGDAGTLRLATAVDGAEREEDADTVIVGSIVDDAVSVT